MHRILLFIFLCAVLPAALAIDSNDNQDLPLLGNRSSSVISLREEHKLGQLFLRSLRGQVQTIDDPVLQNYLEHLVYRLAVHSDVEDRRFYIVIISSKQMNAFSAPGGIIGVNDGIFLYADTQNELAAIIAHELGHLSQRHFAREQGERKQASIPSLAGLLAGIVLLATSGSDAGIAAITAGQAAGQAEMLHFSRQREEEADRAGIKTLEAAGLDPRAMPEMFEKLQQISRYDDQIPEFLMTHPVTKQRIAEAYNLIGNYPKKHYPLSLDFQMMRARVIVHMSRTVQSAIAKMRAGLNDTNPVKQAGSEYGLALALSEADRSAEALKYINGLLKQHPDNITLTIAKAKIESRAEHYDKADKILKSALEIAPENYPLSMAYASTLLKANHPKEAVKVLEPLTDKRHDDVDLWYQLAEAYGLADNIVGVHEARAEYFQLVGNMQQAITQLGYALPLVKGDFQETAKIHARIRQIYKVEQEAKNGL